MKFAPAYGQTTKRSLSVYDASCITPHFPITNSLFYRNNVSKILLMCHWYTLKILAPKCYRMCSLNRLKLIIRMASSDNFRFCSLFSAVLYSFDMYCWNTPLIAGLGYTLVHLRLWLFKLGWILTSFKLISIFKLNLRY